VRLESAVSGLYHRAVAEIGIERVTKAFGAVKAVDDVSLEIGDGEFLVLVGPSGCGKSTLLRLLAGLEDVTGGTIRIGDRDVTDLAPRARDIAMVFQSYALYPHMTVRQNLGYGLRARRTPKDEIDRRVGEVADLLGLSELLERRPAQLSGGQRQRVAMGRAIVRQPLAFLLDEPLSNLDAKLRVGMRASLAQLHQRLGVTTVYVTHDQTEAMTLGQRVAVMRDGRILQCDSPQQLYARPNDLFIAAFIGSPAMNLVEAFYDGETLRFGQFSVPLASAPPRDRLILGVRPEAFRAAAGATALPTIEVRVEVVEDLGSDTHLFFQVDAPPMTAEVLESASEEGFLNANRALFTARVETGTPAAVGATVRLAIDVDRLHYFDPDSGARLERTAVPQLAEVP
jgi:multiple sugar transport system ATP-binding protein